MPYVTLTKHVRELYIPVAVTSTTPQPSFVYIKEYYLIEGLWTRWSERVSVLNDLKYQYFWFLREWKWKCQLVNFIFEDQSVWLNNAVLLQLGQGGLLLFQ